MWRRFMMNRWSRGSAYPYRRRTFVTYSYGATVIVVSLAAILILYLLGYLSL
ncbi:MAG TPA: hypothetical protein VN231_04085 [Allosphingosinicella sp.]|nr:hypothetical protein [Allosphingosinicella sp.]